MTRVSLFAGLSVFVLLAAFLYAPILSLIDMAFFSARGTYAQSEGFTWGWAVSVFENDRYLQSLRLSVLVSLVSSLLATLFAFPLSIGLVNGAVKLRQTVSFLVFFPALLPSLIAAFAMVVFASVIGVSRGWELIVASHVSVFMPFAVGIIAVAYSGMSQDVENAARNLGAGEIAVLFRVTAPRLFRVLLGVAIVVFILSWNEPIIASYVGGFEQTFPVVIAGEMSASLSPMPAAASLVVIAVSILGTAVPLMMILRGAPRRG